jgi:hypothetical protein
MRATGEHSLTGTMQTSSVLPVHGERLPDVDRDARVSSGRDQFADGATRLRRMRRGRIVRTAAILRRPLHASRLGVWCGVEALSGQREEGAPRGRGGSLVPRESGSAPQARARELEHGDVGAIRS